MDFRFRRNAGLFVCAAVLSTYLAPSPTLLAEEPVATQQVAKDAKKAESPKFLRVQRNEDGVATTLQTAIVSYVPANGKSDLVVDLVGAVHVADKPY